jgi:hypothetical protein
MKYFAALLTICLLVGCKTTASQFAGLQLGMSKAAVVGQLGNPTIVRGAMQNKYGSVIEVWEYDVQDRFWPMWLYFADGKLFQWGQPQDWQREAERIYEMRFR